MNLAAVVGIAFFGIIIWQATGEWLKNEKSPIQSVSAVVVGKRREICHRRSNGYFFHSPTYHVVFSLDNGERIELCVRRDEYERLSDGVRGNLTLKGTKYLAFERFKGKKNV